MLLHVRPNVNCAKLNIDHNRFIEFYGIESSDRQEEGKLSTAAISQD